jgi:HemY protein
MLWSLLKVLVFVSALAALALGVSAVSKLGPSFSLTVIGYEFVIGPLQSLLLAFFVVLVVWILLAVLGLILALLRFLTGDETAISRYFLRNKERKGLAARSESMIALASGEARLALTRATKAAKYLDRPELTTLLIAQAAEQVGDRDRAAQAYKVLLADDKTRFVGVRGLLLQKIEEGDTDMALKLAQKAYTLKPHHSQTQDILLELQSTQSDWRGARATLVAKLKSGALPRDIYRRRDAIMALQQARVLVADEASIGESEAVIEANKLSPDLIPAAIMAARHYIGKSDPKNATRVLKKAWIACPHPDLAAAFADIQAYETPLERLKRFKLLSAVHPSDDETFMLMAELNIAAEDFPSARRALGDVAARHPTTRSLAIMAAIERGEGADDSVVLGWLTKALTASRGPQWCCDNCQSIHTQWQPGCQNCAGFDTLSWREPPQSLSPSVTQAELLPLLVRTPNAIQEKGTSDEIEPKDSDVVDTQNLAHNIN